MNSVRSNNLKLYYQWSKPSVCKDIGIINFDFVGKTQFLYSLLCPVFFYFEMVKKVIYYTNQMIKYLCAGQLSVLCLVIQLNVLYWNYMYLRKPTVLKGTKCTLRKPNVL